MKRLSFLFFCAIAVTAACTGSNSGNQSMDTTPVLSPTNNELRNGTDTLGFKTDTLSADSDSVSKDSM